jgi:hypothetical protein
MITFATILILNIAAPYIFIVTAAVHHRHHASALSTITSSFHDIPHWKVMQFGK